VLGPGATDEEVDRLARRVFVNFAKYLVDFFRFSTLDEDYVKRYVKLTGTGHIGTALARGRGAIMLSAHIGNWELGGAALSLSGYPINAVVLTHQNRRINELFKNHRMMGKIRPIEIGPTLKRCYRVLKNNELLALLGDRDFSKSGFIVEFFGHPALMPKGPAVFGYRQGAAILPTFMIRNGDDTFSLMIKEPIYADASLDEEAGILDLARRYLKSIEECIREYPDQWYVFRGLWSEDNERSLRPDTVL
jgi:KDO2-lipid IV(A) lauroyltransferase